MKIAELMIKDTLPRKEFFRASEISSLLKVRPYEIRYWEVEFPKLRSFKSKTGKRMYRREDVVLISAIRHLLQDKNMDIEAAKKIIADLDYVFSPISQPLEAPVEVFRKCTFVQEELKDSSLWQKVHDDFSNHDQILGEVSEILDEEDDFDELTHRIYQHCGEELQNATHEVSPIYVGEMINDAVKTIQAKTLSVAEERAKEKLIDSKNRLTDVLGSLERYQDSGFWHGFNA